MAITKGDLKALITNEFGSDYMAEAFATMFIETMHGSLVAMNEDSDDKEQREITEEIVREAAYDFAADMMNDLKIQVLDKIQTTAFTVGTETKVVVTSNLTFE
jgi:hypothetical protein